jgi:hypothetical protein
LLKRESFVLLITCQRDLGMESVTLVESKAKLAEDKKKTRRE